MYVLGWSGYGTSPIVARPGKICGDSDEPTQEDQHFEHKKVRFEGFVVRQKRV
jgi:hypothetical protein